jgi:protein SCO1/2
MRWNRYINVLSVSALAVSALAFLFTDPASARGRRAADAFPNIELTTQEGKTVHFYDDLIKGKIVAINLIYTRCKYACPLETARLVQVQKMLGDRVGKDIFFYSISIDPVFDTPEVLKAYAEKYHAGPGWTFLTGKKEEIDFLSKKLGLYSDPSINADGHTPHLLIGNDPLGQWMRNSALDNPRFLATMIGEFLDNWKNLKPVEEKSYAEARPLTLDKGQYIFFRQCAACHTIGHGDTIGPDLLGITGVRDHMWLMRKIQTPEQMLEEKDSLTMDLFRKYKEVRMPNLDLTGEQTHLLIGYLQSQNAAPGKEVPAGNGGETKSGVQTGPVQRN